MGGSRRNAIGSGRPGPVRKALTAALEEARADEKLTLEDAVRVLLAERYAALADDATAAGDGQAFTRAADKLLEVIDTLPIRAPRGGGGDDSGSERGRVLQLMDSPPSVGNAADS